MGTRAAIETWAAVAAALGLQLAAFIEDAPGASRPRDYEHLKRQQLVMWIAAAGGWEALPEAAIDPGRAWSRSVDVLLRRRDEILVVEIWDLLDDVGAALRGLDGKCAVMTAANPAATVRGLFVLRGTARNRRLVAEFGRLFSARFPARGGAVLRGLGTQHAPLPPGDGLLWTDVAGTRLIPSRLRR